MICNVGSSHTINITNVKYKIIWTAETDEVKGLQENSKVSKKGDKIAKDARLMLEKQTGKKVVTGENFLPPSKGVK